MIKCQHVVIVLLLLLYRAREDCIPNTMVDQKTVLPQISKPFAYYVEMIFEET